MDYSTTVWNYIVDQYHAHYNEAESVVQGEWEQFLSEFFGYKRLFGEIDSHRIIHIGSGQRTIPDIIVKTKGMDLFDIELKQYNLEFTQDMENQLKSYLDLLHISVGVLICKRIYLYIYDFHASKLKRCSIDFVKDNPLGIQFVEIFQKDSFSTETVEQFIDGQNSFDENVQRIQNTITVERVRQLLKDALMNQYLVEEVSKALEDVVISVSLRKKTEKPRPIDPPKPQADHSSSDSIGKSRARQLFIENGFRIGPNLTYASKNKSAYNYWANPKFDLLQHDWYIILDDFPNRTLKLFVVPANSIHPSELKGRKQDYKQGIIDLQITYNDSTYTDSRSGYSFLKFLKHEIKY